MSILTETIGAAVARGASTANSRAIAGTVLLGKPKGLAATAGGQQVVKVNGVRCGRGRHRPPALKLSRFAP